MLQLLLLLYYTSHYMCCNTYVFKLASYIEIEVR